MYTRGPDTGRDRVLTRTSGRGTVPYYSSTSTVRTVLVAQYGSTTRCPDRSYVRPSNRAWNVRAVGASERTSGRGTDSRYRTKSRLFNDNVRVGGAHQWVVML